MFETVAPEMFARRSRKALYEALPASIAIHAALVAAAVVGQVWTVVFPSAAPAQMIAFNLAEIPLPPPPPPPPPKPLATQLPVRNVMEVPKEILAPTVIPEEIPLVPATPLIAFAEDASPEGVEGGVPGGELGGVIGGVLGGEVGGTIGGIAGGIVGGEISEPNRVIVERDKPLPMYPISQVYPKYPEEARVRAWEDELVVRYVVGTNGRVKEVIVLSHPEREIFAEATIRAIRNWRFRPLIKDGVRKEVVHELTVYYRLSYIG